MDYLVFNSTGSFKNEWRNALSGLSVITPFSIKAGNLNRESFIAVNPRSSGEIVTLDQVYRVFQSTKS